MKGNDFMKVFEVYRDYGFMQSVYTVKAFTKFGAKLKARGIKGIKTEKIKVTEVKGES